jgi:hypothetical protein
MHTHSDSISENEEGKIFIFKKGKLEEKEKITHKSRGDL